MRSRSAGTRAPPPPVSAATVSAVATAVAAAVVHLKGLQRQATHGPRILAFRGRWPVPAAARAVATAAAAVCTRRGPTRVNIVKTRREYGEI